MMKSRSSLIIAIFLSILAIANAFSLYKTTRKSFFNVHSLKPDFEDSSRPDSTLAVIGGFGLGSNALCDFSLYKLQTTMCGLPAGPYGLIGAAEGISYLVVLAIVFLSIQRKVTTGKGLPPGPVGLLGAAEGISYLTLLGILIIFSMMYYSNGMSGFSQSLGCN